MAKHEGWQRRHCGDCEYEYEDQCRRFPPRIVSHQTAVHGTKIEMFWPVVGQTHPACGEFEEGGEWGPTGEGATDG